MGEQNKPRILAVLPPWGINLSALEELAKLLPDSFKNVKINFATLIAEAEEAIEAEEDPPTLVVFFTILSASAILLIAECNDRGIKTCFFDMEQRKLVGADRTEIDVNELQ